MNVSFKQFLLKNPQLDKNEAFRIYRSNLDKQIREVQDAYTAAKATAVDKRASSATISRIDSLLKRLRELKNKRAAIATAAVATVGAVGYGGLKYYKHRLSTKPSQKKSKINKSKKLQKQSQKESVMLLNKNDKKDLVFAMRKSLINEFKKNPAWFGKRLQEAATFVLKEASYDQLLNLTFNPEKGKKEYPTSILEGIAVKYIIENNLLVPVEVLFESCSIESKVLDEAASSTVMKKVINKGSQRRAILKAKLKLLMKRISEYTKKLFDLKSGKEFLSPKVLQKIEKMKRAIKVYTAEVRRIQESLTKEFGFDAKKIRLDTRRDYLKRKKAAVA